MDTREPLRDGDLGRWRRRRRPTPLQGVVVEELAGCVQVLFMIDEELWRGDGGIPRKTTLGVSVPCEPWGYPRRLMVEFRPGSRVRIYLVDTTLGETTEVQPSTIAPVNDGLVAYFPHDSLQGRCLERPIHSVCASGRVVVVGESPVVVMS